MTTLASPQLWIGLGIVGFLFVSLTMILIVLIQKPQGGGLSGAFGSSSDAGGAGQTAFGAKTGDVLVKIDPRYFRPTEVDLLIGDPTKAKEKLGWTHTTKFADLVSEMVRADVALVERESWRKDRSA